MPSGSITSMAVKSEWFGDEIAKEIERATAEALEKVGEDFVKTAEPLTPVDKGELKRSTKADKVKREAGGSLSIEMGSFDIPYAEHQEKGSGRTEGKYFYQRAADQTWPKLDDKIKDSIRKPA